MSFNNARLASDAVAITPSDTVFVNLVGIYVGTTGNVTVTTAAGNDVAFNTVPAGTMIYLQIVKVKETDTTADDIVGLIG